MVNYLGSHDTSRFITQATYRDASGPGPATLPTASGARDGLPVAPPDDEPYDRLWLGMLTLMTLPNTPLLYYGDEYGEFGGGDPTTVTPCVLVPHSTVASHGRRR